MKLENVGEAIATRRLQFLGEPGREVLISLGRPRPSPDSPESGEYFCPFQITGAGDERVRYAAGVDGFQALELALKLIGSVLYRLNSQAGGRLRWEFDESGGLGFPQDFLKT
jgi:hypothetical protein